MPSSLPAPSPLVDLAIVQRIIRIVCNSTSLSIEGACYGDCILPAQVVYKRLCGIQKCTELSFVQSLNTVKQLCKAVYDRIEIPKIWDGESKHFFPEAYSSENKIFCLVLKPIKAQKFYPEVDEKRTWEINDKVWLPVGNPATTESLSNKDVRPINV